MDVFRCFFQYFKLDKKPSSKRADTRRPHPFRTRHSKLILQSTAVYDQRQALMTQANGLQTQPPESTPSGPQDPSRSITQDSTVKGSEPRSRSKEAETTSEAFEPTVLELLHDILGKVKATQATDPSVVELLQSMSRNSKVELLQSIAQKVEGTQHSLQDILSRVDDTIKPTIDAFIGLYQQDRQLDSDRFRRLEKSDQETHRRSTTETQDLQQDIQALTATKEKLEVENQEYERKCYHLQAANEEYAERLISLQPSRRELLPEAAGEKYRVLVARIDAWVGEQVARVTGDAESETWYLQRVERNPAISGPFKDTVKRDSDLMKASTWPESEVEVISAVISRFLFLHMFEGPLYGSASAITTSIEDVGKLMAKQAGAKKDPSAIRSFTAESYQAMIADPDNQQHRGRCLTAVTEKLAGLLRFLAPPGDTEAFHRGLGDEIIEPAFQLQESFLSSSHHRYFFRFQDARDVESAVQSCRSPQTLVEVLDAFDLRNAANNHGGLVFRKLRPQPSWLAFKDGFRGICALYPALMFVDAEGKRRGEGGGGGGGGGDALREPVALEMQRVLVAWTPPVQGQGQGSKNSSSRGGGQQQNASWIHRLLQTK